MFLGNLIKSTEEKYKKIPVSGISFDSRTIKKKNIFFAINGKQNLGTKFIKDAILKGASAIVTDRKIYHKQLKKPIILVQNIRKSLAEASSVFYKKKPHNIIAVTGTNGKSSVADFFYQILNLNKIPVAVIGTLGIYSKYYKKKTKLTSIDPVLLHKSLQVLAIKKINHVILEASSHGLDQNRLDKINIKAGIFTNLSHDHLDYHKNMKLYLNSKMYLFKELLNKKSKIITDEDNKEFKVLKKISNRKKIKRTTIGLNSGDIKILHNTYKESTQIVKFIFNKKVYLLKIPLIGYFQIKNLLMAILAAYSCGITPRKIFSQISNIKSVPGRLECVATLNNNSKIIVDFAHTPEALEKSLNDIKKQFKNEIIIVFGCGGERDKKKRILMGKIAKKYCRKIFVTDDNPRRENPKEIRNEIFKGCGNSAFDIGNRQEAIKQAINELDPSEILLVAGKGHENTQDYGNKIFNFSDKKVIKTLIKKNKNLNKKNNSFNVSLKKVFKNKNLKNFNYSGVSINTNNIKKNNLFFSIKGKRVDGHKFAHKAIKKGAIKVVVKRKINRLPNNKIIKVKRTLTTLNDLAVETRNNTNAKIIGITGSAGKTTLKNLISFSLRNYGKTYHSPHSYNNKFGVPLSISNLKSNNKYGVFEIGMDRKGEINILSQIVRPEIAVITNVSGAHFKNFKTLKDIAKAKSEIIDNISIGGSIVLNKEDQFYSFFTKKAKKKGVNIISFSSKKKANIFLLKVKKIKNIYRLSIIVNNDKFYFNIFHINENFLNNILACISVLSKLNLNLNKIENIFKTFTVPDGRGDIKIVKNFKESFKFIDESYNANPLSMYSSIKNMNSLKKKKGNKKIVLLGDMLELGNKSKKLHKDLSSIINKSDIDQVFVYGKSIKETYNSLLIKKRGKIFNTLYDAYNHLSKIINNNDLLMIKGSNATGLNKFSKSIKKGNNIVI